MQDDEDENKEKEINYYERDINYYTKHKLNEKDFRSFELNCKYNFPMPIIEETVILAPYTDEDIDNMTNRVYQNRKMFFLRIKYWLNIIEDRRKDVIRRNKGVPLSLQTQFNEISLGEFLALIEITFNEYTEALRSSIMRITVFYKRTAFSVMLNNYNKDIYLRHKANMDIQFVTDAFGLATYVAAYIMKSNDTISKILSVAAEEVKFGNN